MFSLDVEAMNDSARFYEFVYYSTWKLKVGPGKVLEFDLALPVWTLNNLFLMLQI